MLAISPRYFGSDEDGSYYHWISFVDPGRATAMIREGLPTVHRSEARSLKAQIERRRGLKGPSTSRLRLAPHTIFVDASYPAVVDYIADVESAPTWGYLMRKAATLLDAYDHEITISTTKHILGEYTLVEFSTSYVDANVVVRAPFIVIPCSYAFGDPKARGVILHRITAWLNAGQVVIGKESPDDYDTELINAKRILEGLAGNLETYALGCSYSARI